MNTVQTFVTIFLGIFIEAAPFLLLGTLASGLVEVLVRRDQLVRLIPSNPVLAPLAGVVLGLAFPVCECGAVPLTRRLFQKGLPLSAGVAFLLAAPIINPIVIASTWAAFGSGVIFWGRIGITVVVAALVGLLFALAPGSQEVLRPAAWVPAAPAPVGNPGSRNWGRDARQALVIAGYEFFDMGRYLVVGALLAATMQTLVPQPVLSEMGLFLYSKISNGTLFFYIHYRLAWLTLLAALLFLVLAAAVMYDATERTDTGEGESCGHAGHTHGVSRAALILLALPVVLGLVVPARPLGAEAVSQRQANATAVAPAQLGGRIQRVEDDDSILGWLRRFSQTADPAAFAGQEADLLGFVFRDERFDPDQFMVARFAIYCCVADAVPVGIVVQWPGAGTLNADTWVRVRGRFEVGEFDGEMIPILVAETVTLTQPPNQPYVYP